MRSVPESEAGGRPVNPPFGSRDEFLEDQMRLAYGYFRDARNPANGLYRDYLTTDAREGRRPVSIAATGMGLISLCIADTEGYEDDAESKAVLSLRALAGELPSVSRGRNAAGFFWHFLDYDTGAALEHRDGISTVDTAILVAGALFCKRYFEGNSEVARLADILYGSIEWERAIASVEEGTFYWNLDEAGNPVRERHDDNAFSGTFGNTGGPFCEAMVLAWLAGNSGSPAAGELWTRHYGSPETLPTIQYREHRLLTEGEGGCALSGFVPLFCYYLAHPFAESPVYMGRLLDAALADRESWEEKGAFPGCFWGCGAGSSANDGAGYRADTLMDNPENIVSPHIISGFLPVLPQGADDLYAIYSQVFSDAETGYGSREFPYGLWRFRADALPSLWVPKTVVSIDFSLMLFGLAERKHPGFFSAYNDFF